MLSLGDLQLAISREVEPQLSALSRTIMGTAHEEGDPDFLIYLCLQYALIDNVIIPMDILDAMAEQLDEPSFTRGMVPESRKWLAENRARTERATAQAKH